MASTNRRQADYLAFLQRIAPDAKRWEPYALLRMVEARAPDMPRIGASRLPAQDMVTMAQAPRLEFAAATVDSIDFDGRRPLMRVRYGGLTGSNGPLPLHLTEYAQYEEIHADKRLFGGLLDLISARFLQFDYRAWAENDAATQAGRSADDTFAETLRALTGARFGARADAAWPNDERLGLASAFVGRRNASTLADVLGVLLGVSVIVEEFLIRRRPVDPADQTRLGFGAKLGESTFIGANVLVGDDAFRVLVLARSADEFTSMLPGGRVYEIICDALRALAPGHLESEIEIGLDERLLPETRLDGATRLGWTAWITPRECRAEIRRDVRLHPEQDSAGKRGARHG